MSVTLLPSKSGVRNTTPAVRVSTSGVLYLNSSLVRKLLDTHQGSRFAVEVNAEAHTLRLVPSPEGYQAQNQQGYAKQIRCKAVVSLIPPAFLDRSHPARVLPSGAVVVEMSA